MTDAYQNALAKALVLNGRLTKSDILFVLTDVARKSGSKHPRKAAQQTARRVMLVLQDAGCKKTPDGGLSL